MSPFHLYVHEKDGFTSAFGFHNMGFIRSSGFLFSSAASRNAGHGRSFVSCCVAVVKIFRNLEESLWRHSTVRDHSHQSLLRVLKRRQQVGGKKRRLQVQQLVCSKHLIRRVNRRGFPEDFVESRHLKLNELKEKAQGLRNQYLIKGNIPVYPRPEFHVSHLKHDTHREGLRGIRGDEGFRIPCEGSLLWWSLVVGPDEIASAERRLLETSYPDRTEEQAQMQQSFLGKFATSPAFMESSRLGSYRLTFPLEEVLKAYSEQFCSGEPPVMRVFKTVLYKQEVMYAVLVHSPANQEKFSNYPLLTDDPKSVCTYKDGCYIWRAEAMCETHRYELVQKPDENQMEAQKVESRHEFYVWDNVAIALHVDKQVLNFDAGRLRENLKFCRRGPVVIDRNVIFYDFPEAEKFVKELWPEDPSPLERADS